MVILARTSAERLGDLATWVGLRVGSIPTSTDLGPELPAARTCRPHTPCARSPGRHAKMGAQGCRRDQQTGILSPVEKANHQPAPVAERIRQRTSNPYHAGSN